MSRRIILALCGVILFPFPPLVPRAEAATLESSPATSVVAIGQQIQVLIYGKDFPNGTDGGDFSLAWSANLAYSGLTIVDPRWDLSSVDATNTPNGSIDSVDVFSSTATPGLAGGPFPVARLTLRATAEGPAFVTIGTNLVGWSLAGGSLEYVIGPDAEIEIQGVPEPGTATALAVAAGLLGSLGRARRQKIR